VAQPERWERLAGIGISDPVPIVRLDRVAVGTSIVMGLIAHVYSLPSALRVDGLLGLSFLSRFRATFEFDTGTLVLRQRPAR
jgi:predicted aspartyl protease